MKALTAQDRPPPADDICPVCSLPQSAHDDETRTLDRILGALRTAGIAFEVVGSFRK